MHEVAVFVVRLAVIDIALGEQRVVDEESSALNLFFALIRFNECSTVEPLHVFQLPDLELTGRQVRAEIHVSADKSVERSCANSHVQMLAGYCSALKGRCHKR